MDNAYIPAKHSEYVDTHHVRVIVITRIFIQNGNMSEADLSLCALWGTANPHPEEKWRLLTGTLVPANDVWIKIRISPATRLSDWAWQNSIVSTAELSRQFERRFQTAKRLCLQVNMQLLQGCGTTA